MGLVSSVFGGGPDQGVNSTFNQAPITDQSNLTGNINQSYGQTQGNLGNENALAQQLLAQSQGQGPNPAQAMLNQATQQNIQSAAGTVASQKGINPALAARLAGEQAGQINQQAAGQAATMGAQQQLGAQSQLGGLYGTMGQQGLTQQQLLQQALANQNNAHVSNMAQSNQANAGLAQVNAKASNDMQAGLVGNAGKGLTMAAMAAMADGGEVQPIQQPGPTSISPEAQGGSGNDSKGPDMSQLMAMAQAFMASGGKVPGKAKVAGNSYANDTVPTLLSPGEIVIPREDAASPDKAKAFVDALMSKRQESGPKGFQKVLKAHAELGKHLKSLAKDEE